MRIISGSKKGRTINPDKGFKARPTTDFAKENLFNILNNHFDFSFVHVLDLFSGTGSISYEFASRGCPEVDAVEINYKHFAFIRKTIEQVGLKQIYAYKVDVFKYIKGCSKKYDIIFADPPFDMEETKDLPGLVFHHGMLKPDGWLIIEHSRNNDFNNHSFFFEKRQYGNVNFSFFKK